MSPSRTPTNFKFEVDFARELDLADPLRQYWDEFIITQRKGESCTYFCGNSLGLQPKRTKKFVDRELESWANSGVRGHFEKEEPWFTYHELSKSSLANLVGAKTTEVVAMNSLTTNLHLLFVSFYRPTKKKYKIMIEAGAFPSDRYIVESQLTFHGFDPNDGIIELQPREGEYSLRTEDIAKSIEIHGKELSLVFFSGVQYYTGQYFNIAEITSSGHKVDAKVGFDLAHAIGNVELQLHVNNVDFAAWCSYKYLNSGPGSVGGLYVHEKYASDSSIPRFAGWWGHDQNERFKMKNGFIPMHGADGWQLSNPNILSQAAHLASLEVFSETNIKSLRDKSRTLTGYLEYLLKEIDPGGRYFTIITPKDPESRGCQLSLLFSEEGNGIFKKLIEHNMIVDWREPNVLRVSPVPVYNTFEEVYHLPKLLEKLLHE